MIVNSGVTLTVSGGSFTNTIIDNSGTLSLTGTMTVNTGCSITGGAVTGSGTLAFTASSSISRSIVSVATITIASTFTLTTDTVTMSSLTAITGGTLSVVGTLSVTGTVTVKGGTLTGGTITGTGTLIFSTSPISISSSTVSVASITVTGITLTLTSVVMPGTTTITNSGTLSLANTLSIGTVTVNGGNIQGPGSITVANSCTLSGVAITTISTITINAGAVLTVSGTTITGPTTVEGPGTFAVSGATTLKTVNFGTTTSVPITVASGVTLTIDAVTVKGGSITGSSTSTLSITSTLSLTSASSITGVTISGGGSLSAPGATLTSVTISTLGGGLSFSGSLNLNGVSITSTNIAGGGGTLNIVTSTSSFTGVGMTGVAALSISSLLDLGASTTITGTITISGAGYLRVSGNALLQTSVSISLMGIEVNSGVTLTLSGAIVTSTAIDGPGTIAVTGAVTLNTLTVGTTSTKPLKITIAGITLTINGVTMIGGSINAAGGTPQLTVSGTSTLVGVAVGTTLPLNTISIATGVQLITNDMYGTATTISGVTSMTGAGTLAVEGTTILKSVTVGTTTTTLPIVITGGQLLQLEGTTIVEGSITKSGAGVTTVFVTGASPSIFQGTFVYTLDTLSIGSELDMTPTAVGDTIPVTGITTISGPGTLWIKSLSTMTSTTLNGVLLKLSGQVTWTSVTMNGGSISESAVGVGIVLIASASSIQGVGVGPLKIQINTGITFSVGSNGVSPTTFAAGASINSKAAANGGTLAVTSDTEFTQVKIGDVLPVNIRLLGATATFTGAATATGAIISGYGSISVSGGYSFASAQISNIDINVIDTATFSNLNMVGGTFSGNAGAVATISSSSTFTSSTITVPTLALNSASAITLHLVEASVTGTTFTKPGAGAASLSIEGVGKMTVFTSVTVPSTVSVSIASGAILKLVSTTLSSPLAGPGTLRVTANTAFSSAFSSGLNLDIDTSLNPVVVTFNTVDMTTGLIREVGTTMSNSATLALAAGTTSILTTVTIASVDIISIPATSTLALAGSTITGPTRIDGAVNGVVEIRTSSTFTNVDIGSATSVVLKVTDGQTLNLNSVSMTGGSINEVTGTGTSTLAFVSGTNTFNGVSVGNTAPLNSITIAAGVTLQTNDIVGPTPTTITGSPITGPGTLTAIGLTTIASASIGTTGTCANILITGGKTLTFNVVAMNGCSIQGTGAGDATLSVTGASTLDGVYVGTVSQVKFITLSALLTVGSSTFVTGATVSGTGSFKAAGPTTLTTVTLSAPLIVDGGVTLSVFGTTFSSSISEGVVGASTISIQGATASSISGTISITNLDSIIIAAGSTLTLSGSVTGNLLTTVSGPGILSVTATSTLGSIFLSSVPVQIVTTAAVDLTLSGVTVTGGSIKDTSGGVSSILVPSSATLLGVTVGPGNAIDQFVVTGTLNLGDSSGIPTSITGTTTISGTGVTKISGSTTLTTVTVSVSTLQIDGAKTLTLSGSTISSNSVQEGAAGTGSTIAVTGAAPSTFSSAGTAFTGIDIVSIASGSTLTISGPTAISSIGIAAINGPGSLSVNNGLSLASVSLGSSLKVGLFTSGASLALTLNGVVMTGGSIDETGTLSNTATLAITASTLIDVTVGAAAKLDIITLTGNLVLSSSSINGATSINGAGGITVRGVSSVTAATLGATTPFAVDLDTSASAASLTLSGVTMHNGSIKRTGFYSGVLLVDGATTTRLYGVAIGSSSVDITVKAGSTLLLGDSATPASASITGGFLNGPGGVTLTHNTKLTGVVIGQTTPLSFNIDTTINAAVVAVTLSFEEVTMNGGQVFETGTDLAYLSIEGTGKITALNSVTIVPDVNLVVQTGALLDLNGALINVDLAGPGIFVVSSSTTFDSITIGPDLIIAIDTSAGNVDVTLKNVIMNGGGFKEIGSAVDTNRAAIIVDGAATTTLNGVNIATVDKITVLTGSNLLLDNNGAIGSTIVGPTLLDGPGTLNLNGPTAFTNVQVGTTTGLPIVLLDGETFTLNSVSMTGGSIQASATAGTTTLTINSGVNTFTGVNIGTVTPIDVITIATGALFVTTEKAGTPATPTVISTATINGPGAFNVNGATTLNSCIIGSTTCTNISILGGKTLTFNAVSMTGCSIQKSGAGTATLSIVTGTSTLNGVAVGTVTVVDAITIGSGATLAVNINGVTPTRITGATVSGVGIFSVIGATTLTGVTLGSTTTQVVGGQILSIYETTITSPTILEPTATAAISTIAVKGTIKSVLTGPVAFTSFDVISIDAGAILEVKGSAPVTISGLASINGPGTLSLVKSTTLTTVALGSSLNVALDPTLEPITLTLNNGVTMTGGSIKEIGTGTGVSTLGATGSVSTIFGAVIDLDAFVITGTLQLDDNAGTQTSVVGPTSINGAASTDTLVIAGATTFTSVTVGALDTIILQITGGETLTLYASTIIGGTISETVAGAAISTIAIKGTTKSTFSGTITFTSLDAIAIDAGSMMEVTGASAVTVSGVAAINGPGTLSVAQLATITSVTLGNSLIVVIDTTTVATNTLTFNGVLMNEGEIKKGSTGTASLSFSTASSTLTDVTITSLNAITFGTASTFVSCRVTGPTNLHGIGTLTVRGSTVFTSVTIGPTTGFRLPIVLDAASADVTLSFNGVTMTEGSITKTGVFSGVLSISTTISTFWGVSIGSAVGPVDVVIATGATLVMKTSTTPPSMVGGSIDGPGGLTLAGDTTFNGVNVGQIATVNTILDTVAAAVKWTLIGCRVTGGTITKSSASFVGTVSVGGATQVTTMFGVSVGTTTLPINVEVLATDSLYFSNNGATASSVTSDTLTGAGSVTVLASSTLNLSTNSASIANIIIQVGGTLNVNAAPVITTTASFTSTVFNGPGSISINANTNFNTLTVGLTTPSNIILNNAILTISGVTKNGGTIQGGATPGDLYVSSASTLRQVTVTGAVDVVIVATAAVTLTVEETVFFGGSITKTGSLASTVSVTGSNKISTLQGVAVGDNIKFTLASTSVLSVLSNGATPTTFGTTGVTFDGPVAGSGTLSIESAVTLTSVVIGGTNPRVNIVILNSVLSLSSVTMSGGSITQNVNSLTAELVILLPPPVAITIPTTLTNVIIGGIATTTRVVVSIRVVDANDVILNWNKVTMYGGSIRKTDAGAGLARLTIVGTAQTSILRGVAIGYTAVTITINSGNTLSVSDLEGTITTMNSGTLTGPGVLSITASSTFALTSVTNIVNARIIIGSGGTLSLLTSGTTTAISTSTTIDGPGTFMTAAPTSLQTTTIGTAATFVIDSTVGPITVTIDGVTVTSGRITKVGTNAATISVTGTATNTFLGVAVTGVDLTVLSGATLRLDDAATVPTVITTSLINGPGTFRVIGDATLIGATIGTTLGVNIDTSVALANVKLIFNNVGMTGGSIFSSGIFTATLSVETTTSTLKGVTIGTGPGPVTGPVSIVVRWAAFLDLNSNSGTPCAVIGGTLNGAGTLRVITSTTFTTVTMGNTNTINVLIADLQTLSLSGGSFVEGKINSVTGTGSLAILATTNVVVGSATTTVAIGGTLPILISLAGTMSITGPTTINGGKINGAGLLSSSASTLTMTNVVIGDTGAVDMTVTAGTVSVTSSLIALDIFTVSGNSHVTLQDPNDIPINSLTLQSASLTLKSTTATIASLTWTRTVAGVNSVIDGTATILVTNFVIGTSTAASGTSRLLVPVTVSGSMTVGATLQLTIENVVTIATGVIATFSASEPTFPGTGTSINTVNGGVWDVYGTIASSFNPAPISASVALYLGDAIVRPSGRIDGTAGTLDFRTILIYFLSGQSYYSSCCRISGFVFPLANFNGILAENGQVVTLTASDAGSPAVAAEIRILGGGTVEIAAGAALTTSVLRIDSGKLIGAGSLTVTNKFVWTHILQKNADTEISGTGAITLAAGATAEIYLENFGTGSKYMKKVITSFANTTLYTNGLITNLFGAEGSFINKDLITIVDSPPVASIIPPDGTSNSGLCGRACAAVAKRVLPDFELALKDPSYMIIPTEWTCANERYGDGETCDCSCGAVDPDCADVDLPVFGCHFGEQCGVDGTCIQPAQGFTTDSKKRQVVGWTCPDEQYNSFARGLGVTVTCDCNCGVYDPDCNIVPTPPTYGCPYKDVCDISGTCIPGGDVAVTWINHMTVTSKATAVGAFTNAQFGPVINENNGLIDASLRPVRMSSLVWNDALTTPFFTASSVTLSGILQGKTIARPAAAITTALSITGSCTLAAGTTLTVDTFDWSPPTTGSIIGGTIDISQRWRVGGAGAKIINNVVVNLNTPNTLWNVIADAFAFSTGAQINIASGAQVELQDTGNFANGIWVNNGVIRTALNLTADPAASTHLGTVTTHLSSTSASDGLLTASQGAINTAVLNVNYDTTPVFVTSTPGLQTIVGAFSSTSWGATTLSGGVYAIDAATLSPAFTTFTLQDDAAVTATNGIATTATFNMKEATLAGTTAWTVSADMTWNAATGKQSGLLAGGDITVNGPLTIGNAADTTGTAIGTLTLDRILIANVPTVIEVYPMSMLLNSNGVLRIPAAKTMNLNSGVSVGFSSVITTGTTGGYIDNSGIIVISGTPNPRDVNMGKVVNRWNGRLDATIGRMIFTDLDANDSTNVSFLFDGAADGTQTIAGVVDKLSWATLILDGGSALNLFDTTKAAVVSKLTVTNGALLQLVGTGNLPLTTFALYSGTISGDGSLSISTSGIWQRQVVGVSSIDGTGVITVNAGAQFNVETLSTLDTQILADGRKFVVAGTMTFVNDWFSKANQDGFNIEVRPTGVLDISSLVSGSTVLSIIYSEGIVIGPASAVRFTLTDLTLVNTGTANGISLGADTTAVILKLAVKYDTVNNMFTHDPVTSVTIRGEVKGTTWSTLLLQDAGTATFFPSPTLKTITMNTLNVLNQYNLTIGSRIPVVLEFLNVDSATLDNRGKIQINNSFKWTAFSASTVIAGDVATSEINITSAASLQVSGSVLLNMAMTGQTLTNYGTITFKDTDNALNLFVFGSRTINRGTMNLKITSSSELGALDNYGTVVLQTSPYELVYTNLINRNGATWTSTGLGRTKALTSLAVYEGATMTTQSTVDSEIASILRGTLNAIQTTFSGTTNLDKTYYSSAKVTFQGDLFMSSARALGFSGCVNFRDVHLHVAVETSVREFNFTTIDIGSEGVCRTYGTILDTVVSSYDKTIYDLCEFPIASASFQNALLYIMLSVDTECKPVSYVCGQPNSVCPTGCVVGTSCPDINECTQSPIQVCSTQADCIDTAFTGGIGFQCVCKPGWTGNGRECVDINECDNNPCLVAGQVCENLPGSYRCNSCPTGFIADATGSCIDINECATANKCKDPLRPCINVPGSYYCRACPQGYFGDTDATCIDINECANNLDSCLPNTCINTIGSYICGSCPVGYYLPFPGATCIDIDECALGLDFCSPLRECKNTDGSYLCGSCPRGYTNNGDVQCYDTNECYLDPSLNGPCKGRTCILDDSGWFYCGQCSTDPPQYFDTAYTCAPREVIPHAECKQTAPDGSSLVYFGYTSTFTDVEEIPLSENFMIGVNHTSHPTLFFPGTQRYAFSVPLPTRNDTVTWIIRTLNATSDGLPNCPLGAPEFNSNTFTYKSLAVQDLKLGVIVFESVFDEDSLFIENSCDGTTNILEVADCPSADASCVGIEPTNIFASTVVTGNILNFKQCRSIYIVVETSSEYSPSKTGTMTFTAGEFSKQFTLNADPSLKSQVYSLCCSDVLRVTKYDWYGDFKLDITLNSLTVSVSILRDGLLDIKHYYPRVAPTVSCGTNINAICEPFHYETNIPAGACRYINMPATPSPTGDYLLLSADRNLVDTLPIATNKIVSAIVLWWRNANQVPNVYTDRDQILNASCGIRYPVTGPVSSTKRQDAGELVLIETGTANKRPLGCDYNEFVYLQNQFQLKVDELSAGKDVTKITQQATAYALSDEWQNCAEWADTLIQSYVSDTTSPACQWEVDSAEYLEDPCCNDNLDQCCVGNPDKKMPFVDEIFARCSLPSCSNQTATSYSSIRQSTSADRLNCEATTREITNGDGFSPVFNKCLFYTYGQTCTPYPDEPVNSITKWYDTTHDCKVDVHPQSFCTVEGLCTAPCETDDECTSGVCFDYGTYKSCTFLPQEDTAGQEKLVQCLKEQTNVFLLLFMRDILGATEENFDTLLFNTVTGGSCAGAPLADAASITDEATCELKKYCNWAVCEINGQTCTEEECNDFTHMGSGEYCTLCLESADGRACPEVSTFDTCVVTEPAYTTYYGLCDFYGYSYNSLSNTPCVDATATTRDACNPPEYCENELECEGRCIYPHLTTDIECRSMTVNGLFLEWITWIRDGKIRGLCVLDNADALSCPRNFGLWRPGTKWATTAYDTKASCESGGQCSDSSITNKVECESSGFCDVCPECTTPESCAAAGVCNNHHGCMMPYTNGRCFSSSWTPYGCLYTEYNQFVCQTNGGRWIDQLTNEEECLQTFLCQSSTVPDFDMTVISDQLVGLTDIPLGWNNKSEATCEACADKWVSVYQFKRGVWSPRVWSNFQWQSRSVLNYKWINTFQEDSFTSLIESSRDQYLATIKTTELLCKYGEEKELIYRLSCDCATDNDCASLLDQVQYTSTGVYRHCENIVTTSEFIGGTLSNGEDFVVLGDLQCVSVKTELVPFSQFLSQSSSTIGNVIISGPQTVRDQVIYYKNDNDIVVGKLLGDGVGLSYSANSTSGLGAVRGLQFCMELPQDPQDKLLKFQYFDLALANADFTDFTVLDLQLPLTATRACIDYPGGNMVYFPIGLREGYNDSVYYDTWQTTELAVDYLGLAIYSILLITCFYLLYGHYYVLKTSNRAVTLKRVFNLPRLVLIVVAIFLIVRIIFFSLVPQGILESDPAVNVIFAQLPPLIFLSAYILMLMKWAVMYNTTIIKEKIQRNAKDDKPVKIGLLISFLLWLFFIIIIILLFTVPGDAKKFTCVTPQSERDALTEESIIAVAYNSFYAFVCFCCAGLFVFMGYGFYKKLDEDSSEGASAAAAKRKAVSKLLIVMLGCSAILVIQATILIVQAAGVAFSALDRLIVIICVEVPPTITFFIMCSANSAISKAKKSDFRDKTVNSRGSIMLQKFTPKKSKAGSKGGESKSSRAKPDAGNKIDMNAPVTIATVKQPPKNIEDEPVTIAMVPKARAAKAQPENPFLAVTKEDPSTSSASPGGLKLVPRDNAAVKPTDSSASTGITLKLKTADATQSGFRPPTQRQQPNVTPRVDLSSADTPVVTTIPGTGVKLVHGTASTPGSSPKGLKFVPRDNPTSPPQSRKKDPLDDKLGPVTLKMVARPSQGTK